MTEKENKTLSDWKYPLTDKRWVYPESKVKEFIKRLKDFCDGLLKEIKHPAPRLAIINIESKIDKLAGEELLKK